MKKSVHSFWQSHVHTALLFGTNELPSLFMPYRLYEPAVLHIQLKIGAILYIDLLKYNSAARLKHIAACHVSLFSASTNLYINFAESSSIFILQSTIKVLADIKRSVGILAYVCANMNMEPVSSHGYFMTISTYSNWQSMTTILLMSNLNISIVLY